jgi:excisionase family DNA binding protein
MAEKEVFTTFEAAKLCHVSPLSIINWVNAGRLAAFRTPGGHRRIRRDDLFGFMRDNGLPLPTEFAESTRRRVLVVDDDASVRHALVARFLSGASAYSVEVAASGFEAGRLLASFRPDILVLDLRVPGLDGFQVCRAIKADPKTARVRLVAMTGAHTPEIEARILDCGAERCFSKPVDPATVVDCVNGLFERGVTARRRGSPRSPGSAS